MATPQAPPQSNQITVPLFKSAHGGYGSARDRGDFRYNRVHRGWDTRFPGELRIADAITALTYPATLRSAPIFAGVANDLRGAAIERHPVLVLVVGTAIYQIRFGTIESVGFGATANATGACFHDDGSGLAYLYICSGTGAGLDRSAGSGAVSATANASPFNIDKLASISGALYGSVRGTSSNRWNSVQFVPYGADPFTGANWSGKTRVGHAWTDINNITQVRGVPVVLKPEGIFMYNRALDQWENMMPAWEFDFHLDNGRACVSLGPNLIIGRGDGGAIVFDGYSVQDISPYKNSLPDLDTTSQIFSCFGAAEGKLLAATAVSRGLIGGIGTKQMHTIGGFETYNQKLTKSSGITTSGPQVWKTTDNEATFTSYTTNTTDGSLSTVGTLGALDTAANGDYFYVGYRFPWRGVLIEFDTGAGGVNTNAATLTGQYWDGSVWQSMALQDFTDLSGATLGQSGVIVLTGNPTDWTARSISTDTQTYYYIRFSVSAVLSATVSPAEIALLPWRPSVDTTNHADDGIDRSGGYAHFIVAESGEQLSWHDMGTGRSNTLPDEIGAIAMAPIGGAYGTKTNKIVALGKHRAYIFHLNNDETWPILQTNGFHEGGWITPANGAPVRLREVVAYGRDFPLTPSTSTAYNISFYYRYDANQRWTRMALGARPPFVSKKVSDEGKGTTFQWGIGFNSTHAIPERRPAITGIEAIFEVLDEPINKVPQRPIATPPRG